jgi:hypothetical protein
VRRVRKGVGPHDGGVERPGMADPPNRHGKFMGSILSRGESVPRRTTECLEAELRVGNGSRREVWTR